MSACRSYQRDGLQHHPATQKSFTTQTLAPCVGICHLLPRQGQRCPTGSVGSQKHLCCHSPVLAMASRETTVPTRWLPMALDRKLQEFLAIDCLSTASFKLCFHRWIFNRAKAAMCCPSQCRRLQQML